MTTTPTAPRELKLGYDDWLWWTRVIVALALGGISGLLYTAALVQFLNLDWPAIRDAANSFVPERDVVLMLPFALGAAAISVGLLLARQPKRARLTWDDDGLTEWDGDAIRAHIPWAKAKAHRVNVVVVRRGARESGGVLVQFSDGEGRLITANGSRLQAPWMQLRRVEASFERALDLLQRADRLPRAPGLDADADSLKRPSLLLWRFLYFAAKVDITVSLLLFRREREAAPTMAAGALMVLLTTLLVPVRELWRLRRPDLDGAEHVELMENQGAVVTVKAAHGTEQVDFAPLKHRDPLIATRRTGAYLKRSGGAAVALETDAERAARQALIRAVWLEVGVRLAIVAAVLLILFLQERARHLSYY
jgi:hypothetical protein